MENLRKGHCLCWDFPGLQRRYEFADIYSLIGPRPLQCQNGRLERLPGGFPIDLAEQAMAEIRQAYARWPRPRPSTWPCTMPVTSSMYQPELRFSTPR